MYECPECGVGGKKTGVTTNATGAEIYELFDEWPFPFCEPSRHAKECSRQQKPVKVDRKVEMMSEEEARQAGRDKPDDPWAHRSERMKCRTCMWYITKNAAESMTDLGRCRKRSPTMDGYPVVFPDDWCGDHKVDENAK